MRVIEGFSENGIPAGKRDLRDSKANLESNFFRNPTKLLQDTLALIVMFLFWPINSFVRRFTQKPKSLKGKICFVTGSGRGLGRAICMALAREGAIVACADINEESNNKTVELLRQMGAKAIGYRLNVADKQEVESVAKRVESDIGRVYLLVNNAAILMPSPDNDEKYVRAVINVNTLGPIWTVGAFLPGMKESKEGHIVNISSVAAGFGVPILTMYCASKAALSRYSQGLRMELMHQGFDNIHVTAVHPSFINTTADYCEAVTSRLPVYEMDYIVRLTMKSIKYNKTDVTTSPVLFFLVSIASFFPREIIMGIINWMDPIITIPTSKEFNDLPTGNLVKDSINFSNADKSKEKAT